MLNESVISVTGPPFIVIFKIGFLRSIGRRQIVIGGAVLFSSAIYQIVDLSYCCEPGTTKSIRRRWSC